MNKTVLKVITTGCMQASPITIIPGMHWHSVYFEVVQFKEFQNCSFRVPLITGEHMYGTEVIYNAMYMTDCTSMKVICKVNFRSV